MLWFLPAFISLLYNIAVVYCILWATIHAQLSYDPATASQLDFDLPLNHLDFFFFFSHSDFDILVSLSFCMTQFGPLEFPMCCGSKQVWITISSTTMIDSCYEVLVDLWLTIKLHQLGVFSLKDIIPEYLHCLWFVRLQFCKSNSCFFYGEKGFFY